MPKPPPLPQGAETAILSLKTGCLKVPVMVFFRILAPGGTRRRIRVRWLASSPFHVMAHP